MTIDPISLRQFLAEQERVCPDITTDLVNLILDIVLGCEKVLLEVRKFGLSRYQHMLDVVNVQGEQVHALDDLADEIFVKLCLDSGLVCAVGTEEREEIVLVPQGQPAGDYVVMIDPLDGFSNIRANVNIGTIFLILKKVSSGRDGCLDDFMRPGREQVCAGYLMYGPAMVLVFTLGHGVHEFTYDSSIGDFFLSRQKISIPRVDELPEGQTPCYSINEGYRFLWDERVASLIDHFKRGLYSSRHIGSLVADFHRNLLTGGFFAYPANSQRPNGKLRLLCELMPLSFIVEQAGGWATNGQQRILDLVPQELHQRSPVFIGSSDAIEIVEKALQ